MHAPRGKSTYGNCFRAIFEARLDTITLKISRLKHQKRQNVGTHTPRVIIQTTERSKQTMDDVEEEEETATSRSFELVRRIHRRLFKQ